MDECIEVNKYDIRLESQNFVKNKAKIASGVCGMTGGVVYFSKLFFVTNEE